MKSLLLVAAFLASSFIVSAQEYGLYIDSAYSAFDEERYALAATYFDSAFAISKKSYASLYDAACANSLAGNLKKSTQYLRTAFENGYDDFSWMYYDKDLNPIRKEQEYLLLEKKYKPKSTLYFFDILENLRENKIVTYLKLQVDLNETVLAQYSLAEINNRLDPPPSLTSTDTLFQFPDRTLTFHECSFSLNHSFNSLHGLALESIMVVDCDGNLSLSNVDVKDLIFYETFKQRKGNKLNNLKLKNVIQHGKLQIFAHGFMFYVEDCTFNVSDEEIFNKHTGLHWTLNYETIELYNATFNKIQNKNRPFDFKLTSTAIKIVNSTFNFNTLLNGTASEALTIKWSNFPEFIDPFNFRFPEDSYIPFSQFKNTQFARFDVSGIEAVKIAGDSLEDFKDESLFDMLTPFYKNLYDIYRARGDLASANSCYIRLKELEITYLKLKKNKDLEEIIRLRLNQLMGLYTDHATSPGKAILCSFYIILLFGVFYFFFPSEWDKGTKAQLLTDYQLFVKKNEHGYLKPFLKMVKGFTISFLNAITLSINAFITLGFGNIPTTGFARYVCVLQGMLGWFLLSLFTVALLNEVLI